MSEGKNAIPEAVGHMDMGQKEAAPQALPPKGKIGRYLRDEGTVFRLSLACLTGIVAAVIIVFAGLNAERQFDVVMTRAVVGFCVAGASMFLGCLWLDTRGIPLYVSRHEEFQNSWVSEPEAGIDAVEEEPEGSPLEGSPFVPDLSPAAAEPADDEEDSFVPWEMSSQRTAPKENDF